MSIKKISALLLVALLAVSAFGCGNKEDDKKEDDILTSVENNVYQEEDCAYGFTYGVSGEGTYEITGFVYSGTALVDVEIPEKILEREVTGIADDAFKAIKTIRSVDIPEGMSYVGAYAFYDCDEITAVTLPSTVAEIGEGAFRDCGKLESVTLSGSLKEIKRFTFMDCPVLKGVSIPAGVTVIGDCAFFGCEAIEEITLPEALTDLGDVAFYGCKSLKKATVKSTVLGVDVDVPIDPEKPMDEENKETIVHNIGDFAFGNCNPDAAGRTKTEFTVTANSEFAAYVAALGYTVAE